MWCALLSALGSAALVVNEQTIPPACAFTLSSMSATINAQAAGADGCEARAWRIAPGKSLDRIQFNTSQSYFEGTDTLDFFAVESDGQLRSLTQHSQPFSASNPIPPVLWLTQATDEVVLVLDAPSGGSSFIMHYSCTAVSGFLLPELLDLWLAIAALIFCICCSVTLWMWCLRRRYQRRTRATESMLVLHSELMRRRAEARGELFAEEQEAERARTSSLSALPAVAYLEHRSSSQRLSMVSYHSQEGLGTLPYPTDELVTAEQRAGDSAEEGATAAAATVAEEMVAAARAVEARAAAVQGVAGSAAVATAAEETEAAARAEVDSAAAATAAAVMVAAGTVAEARAEAARAAEAKARAAAGTAAGSAAAARGTAGSAAAAREEAGREEAGREAEETAEAGTVAEERVAAAMEAVARAAAGTAAAGTAAAGWAAAGWAAAGWAAAATAAVREAAARAAVVTAAAEMVAAERAAGSAAAGLAAAVTAAAAMEAAATAAVVTVAVGSVGAVTEAAGSAVAVTAVAERGAAVRAAAARAAVVTAAAEMVAAGSVAAGWAAAARAAA
ncbi:hypothetical protein EMIHUDRAFT_116525, partial [Emiliania huxleyi CCMP1516]|uniref:DOMON domain-containing protein n=2 Tax=Emiliania huxleyi TaxID=2903 RepID=A0A0D3JIF5_EMIH1